MLFVASWDLSPPRCMGLEEMQMMGMLDFRGPWGWGGMSIAVPKAQWQDPFPGSRSG